MSEKSLSELEWRKFAKGKGYKDAPFVKALAALEGAASDGARQLEALTDIAKQAAALRSASKADKALDAYLDDVDKTLPRLRKGAEALAKKAADEGEEEEASPALLTTRLLPLLRQVAGGEVMQVMVGLAGKQTVVLLARRSISPARRKLLVEYAGDVSGMKFITGQCLFEADIHTFVLAAGASGLAKKIKGALLGQTGKRWKVRVRGEDPNDVDEDLDEDEGVEAEAQGATPVPEAPPAPPRPAIDTKAIAARLAGLQAAIRQALAGPAGAQVRAGVVLLTQLIKDGDGAAAEAELARIEAQLQQAAAAAPAAAAPAAAPQPTPGGAVDYAKCRLAWEGARKKVHGELQTLEQIILTRYRSTKAFSDLNVKIRKLDSVLASFEDKLEDMLDAAYTASDPAARSAHQAEAARAVQKFLAHARQDAFIAQLQNNPFQPVTVQTTLVGTLEILAKRLA